MTEGYGEIDGYNVSYGFHDEIIRSELGYKPVHGDVFIVSYPKCGTTWLQHIVYKIFNGRAPPKNMMGILREMTSLEMVGAESIKDMPRPGAIKTHMPFQLQPYSKDAKYLYIARNPYDCCVSFYHTKGLPHCNFADVTFDEFFKMFIEGKVSIGAYFDHLLSCCEHRNDPNVLFLTYENLKKDTAAWVLKIADFLGKEYGLKLRANPGVLDEVREQTNMVRLKKHVNKGLESSFVELKVIPEDRRPRWVKLRMDAVGKEALKKPVNFTSERKL